MGSTSAVVGKFPDLTLLPLKPNALRPEDLKLLVLRPGLTARNFFTTENGENLEGEKYLFSSNQNLEFVPKNLHKPYLDEGQYLLIIQKFRQ